MERRGLGKWGVYVQKVQGHREKGLREGGQIRKEMRLDEKKREEKEHGDGM